MKEAEYITWSGRPFSTRGTVLMTNVKGPDLQPGVGEYVPCKQPGLFKKTLNVITQLWKFPTQSFAESSVRVTEPPYTIEKVDLCDKKPIVATTSSMPVFETKKDGTGQLTVPLDYDSTADDIAMTPAGIYMEDMSRSERNATRSVPIRKRRNQLPKTTQRAAEGGSGSAKAAGKNRKDKKRHSLRMDIVNDSVPLSLDDCYGYDYREADFEDAIGSGPLCLTSSFSPSSIESMSSFHDALQDALVMEACMQPSFVAVPAPSADTAVTPPQLRNSATPATPTVGDRVNPKCDIESDRSEFVVYTDYDVFTTPSASPARRRPSRSLCRAFTYVWQGRFTDGGQQDDEDDDEEDWDEKSGYSSDDATGDEFDNYRPRDQDEEEDEDDYGIVFCEDIDDSDDTNSSSGFGEKKVRFNMKPALHVMRVWDFAYRQARKGEWEMAARDRERFRKRIDDLEPVLGPALQPTLRDKVYAERFASDDTQAQDVLDGNPT